MSSLSELKIEIFGRVQGVGFRQFVQKEATALKIAGSVRNKEDGTVLIIAQGSREKLDDFLEVVQKGSLLSHVSGVSYLWQEPKETYKDFVIAVKDGFIKDQKSSFTNLGKKLLGLGNSIPKHVAIIPDGNRRWAKAKGLISTKGHEASASYDNVVGLLTEAKRLGIKYLTFWAFSTENWKRDKFEVNALFSMAKTLLAKLRVDAEKNKVRFRHIGRRDRLPKELVSEIEKLEEATKKFDSFNVQMCLDYGGRDEISRAINKMLKLGVTEITEKDVSHYLDTQDIPDPDLIIRTSGEQRTSGFMPFQSAYAELYFADCYFPDFGPAELKRAVEEFSRRKRNFGV